MVGAWRSVQGSKAWQKVGEISNKSVTAWRSGPGIAPQFTQELAHGCGPFSGLATG